MALGAEPRRMSRMALRKAVGQLVVGVPMGLLGALAVGRLLQSLLVQTSPYHPVTLVGIVILLVTVAIAACIVPARRAARLDPVAALRVE